MYNFKDGHLKVRLFKKTVLSIITKVRKMVIEIFIYYFHFKVYKKNK